MKLVNRIAETLATFRHSNNDDYFGKVQRLVRENMPIGQGFDVGTELDHEKSAPDRLVFTTRYLHKDEDGFWSNYSYHSVTVAPTFFGMNIEVVSDYAWDTNNLYTTGEVTLIPEPATWALAACALLCLALVYRAHLQC